MGPCKYLEKCSRNWKIECGHSMCGHSGRLEKGPGGRRFEGQPERRVLPLRTEEPGSVGTRSGVGAKAVTVVEG